MKHMKNATVLRLLGWLILVSLLLGSMGQTLVLGAQPEPLVLARVEVTDGVDALGLPVYAHLQDAAGKEYALVIAPVSQLDQAGVDYRILDTEASGSAYVVALERRVGARQQAAQVVNVLLDDGLHIVARATLEQAEALAELGFDIQRLDDVPMILGAPVRLAAEPLAVEYDPTVAEMINQVQQGTVYTYDGNLSGEWPVSIGGSDYTILTRYTRSGTPIQKATQYAYEFMQDLGLTVSYHNWTYGSTSNRNVIGEQTGTTQPGEIVLITAHLDDVPSTGLAPGADDNASGSTGVMVAAEILSQYQFERTMRFVFFTGEEQGLYGSKEYADLVYDAGENIVAVYNMDMIAWDELDGPTLRLHTRTTTNPGYSGDRAIADLFVDVVNTYGLSSSLTPIIDADGITASDHSPFWNRGYSAILAIEDDEDDFCAYYHTANDRLQYLNMPYFTNYTKASVGTAAHLALLDSGTPPTPTATPTDTPTPTATPEGSLMHVEDIAMATKQAGPNRSALATVTIVDANNVPVSGAMVYGIFSGATNESVSGQTDAYGQVTLESSKVKDSSANWTFCVDNVVKSGWTYDPAVNVETCDSTGVIPTPTATATPGGGVMHVDDIAMSYQQAGKNYKAKATVPILDANSAPVEGATVYGTFSGATNESVSGVTGADGQVTLTSSNKKDGGTWQFCVDDVVKSGWTYDLEANVENCDSITTP